MNVLVTGARAPIAAELTRALAGEGHRVWLADSVRFPIGAACRKAEGTLRLPAPRTDFRAFAAALAGYCTHLQIDAILPTSEEVFWLAAARPLLPPRVVVRTGALETLARLHHKFQFALLAKSLGYGAEENHLLDSVEVLQRLREPERYVVKPVFSRFATETRLGPTRAQLAELGPTAKEPWLAQTRVLGKEYCLYNLAHEGRLLLHVAYEPSLRFGVGASVCFSPVQDRRLYALSLRFIEETCFTGQISFDVIDGEHGLVAIECNPRGTSGAHLAVQRPGDFARALLGIGGVDDVSFCPEPRLLTLPLLLTHPGAWFEPANKTLLKQAKDALRLAGVSVGAQVVAFAELGVSALAARTGLARASTRDFEWNGEPFDA